MKNPGPIAALVYFFAFSLFIEAATVQPDIWTNQRLKKYSEQQKLINPKGGDLYQQVRQMYPGRNTYTNDQVLAVTNPFVKKDKNYDPTTIKQKDKDTDSKGNRIPMPPDAIRRDAALELLANYELLHPGTTKLVDALYAKYGKQDWYTPDQLSDVETNGAKPAKVDNERPPQDPVEIQIEDAKIEPKPWWTDFKSPMIRQSWSDVLYADDPSQSTNQSKTIKDLVGATFSYADNAKAHSQTWTAIGAVILPWEEDVKLSGGLEPARLALAPSVSIDRVDTNVNSKNDVDTLIYRVGMYAEWNFATPRPTGLQLRAAPVYVTDTNSRARLPGYEIDIEPHWQDDWLPLGYTKPLPPLFGKISLNFKTRAWLHIEGGDVQNDGNSWNTTKGSFSRLGPVVQLQINAPHVLFGKDASFTGIYSYLPPISGPDTHESYFKISSAYDIIKNDETGQKISLNIQYEKGGLDFTKQDVDTFTIGLGV